MEKAKKIISFFDSVYVLKNLPRMGWLYVGVPISAVETVATHSYFVALWSYVLGSLYPEKLDMYKVLRLAILHDLGEAYIHDIGGPTRRYLSKELIVNKTLLALGEMLSLESPLREEILGSVKEYELGDSPEARLVRLADKLDMYFQATRYMRSLGDSEKIYREFLEGARLDDMNQEVFREIIRRVLSRGSRNSTRL